MATSINSKADFTLDDDIMAFFSLPETDVPFKTDEDRLLSDLKFPVQNDNAINCYGNNVIPWLDDNTDSLKCLQSSEGCGNFKNHSVERKYSFIEFEDSAKRCKIDADKALQLIAQKDMSNVCTQDLNLLQVRKIGNEEQMKLDIEDALNNVCKSNIPIAITGEKQTINVINSNISTVSNNDRQSNLSTAPLERINFTIPPTSNLSLPIKNGNSDILEQAMNETKQNFVMSPIVNYAMSQPSNIVKPNLPVQVKKDNFNIQQPLKLKTIRLPNNTNNSFKIAKTVKSDTAITPVGLRSLVVRKSPRENVPDELINNSLSSAFDDILSLVSSATEEDAGPPKTEYLPTKFQDSLNKSNKKTELDMHNGIGTPLVDHSGHQLTVLDFGKIKRKGFVIFSCDKCTFKTKWKKNYVSHVQNEHQPENNLDTQSYPDFYRVKSGWYVCQLCYFIFRSLQSIQSHYEIVHTKAVLTGMDNGGNSRSQHINEQAKKEAQVCTECGYVFGTKAKLLQHQLNHKNLTQCSSCDRKLSCHAKLQEHIRINHLNINGFGCYICDKKFKLARYLRVHMKTHTNGGVRVSCPNCPEKFISKNELTLHVRSKMCGETGTLVESRARSCNRCGVIEASNVQLANHLEKCLSDGDIVSTNTCPFCGLILMNRRELRLHLLRHNKNDLPNQKNSSQLMCPKCQVKSFSNKASLSKHSLTCRGTKLAEGRNIYDCIVISDSD